MAKKRKGNIKKKKAAISTASYLINNGIILFSFLTILFFLQAVVPSYNWLTHKLIRDNLRVIAANPHLSVQKKYEIKLGFDYRYISAVRKNTPDNAVILMPPREVLLKSNFNKKSAWGVKNKTWCTYFLYPRKLVREEERETHKDLYRQVTHVMIVNGWGYQKLHYPVSRKFQYAIVAIDRPGGKK